MLNLPHPHGECISEWEYQNYDQKDYSPSKCKMDKKKTFITETCGCKDFYMPPRLNEDNQENFCSLEQYQNCTVEAESMNKCDEFKGENQIVNTNYCRYF